MKKIILILIGLFLIACDNDEFIKPTNVENIEVVDVIMTITAYDDAEIYESPDCENIVQTDNGTVYSVVDVVSEKNRIQSYKVYLGSNHYGFVKEEEFYVIELMDESFGDLMVPQFDTEKILLYHEMDPKDCVYSPLKFDFFLNRKEVGDTFNLETKKSYFMSAVAYDQLGNSYKSEEISFYDIKTLAPCQVFNDLSDDGVVINSYMLLEDYEDKIIDYVISYENGEFTKYYRMQEEAQVGYVKDSIEEIEVHNNVTVKTPEGEITVEHVEVRFDKGNGYLNMLHEDDFNILVNMTTGSHLNYQGKYRLIENETWQENFIAIIGKDSYDMKGIEIRDTDSLELITSLEDRYYRYNTFRSNEDAITFQMYGNKYDYWPASKNNSTSILASLIKYNDTYKIEVDDPYESKEPILENVALYRSSSSRSEVLERFSSKDILKVENENIVEIIDGQLVYWFSINTKTNKGYAYRSAFDFEEILVASSDDYILVDKNGKRYNISDIIEYRYNDIEFNDDFVTSNIFSYKKLNSYDQSTYYIDLDHYTTIKYEKATNKKTGETIISFFDQEEYGVSNSSEVKFYHDSDDTSEGHTMFKFKRSEAYDFIWIDENTISCFIRSNRYHLNYIVTPSVFKKIDGKWMLESEIENYDVIY